MSANVARTGAQPQSAPTQDNAPTQGAAQKFADFAKFQEWAAGQEADALRKQMVNAGIGAGKGKAGEQERELVLRIMYLQNKGKGDIPKDVVEGETPVPLVVARARNPVLAALLRANAVRGDIPQVEAADASAALSKILPPGQYIREQDFGPVIDAFRKAGLF